MFKKLNIFFSNILVRLLKYQIVGQQKITWPYDIYQTVINNVFVIIKQKSWYYRTTDPFTITSALLFWRANRHACSLVYYDITIAVYSMSFSNLPTKTSPKFITLPCKKAVLYHITVKGSIRGYIITWRHTHLVHVKLLDDGIKCCIEII